MNAQEPAGLSTYACPQCRKQYRIRNAQPGKKYLCKDCRAALAPAAEPSAAEAPATVLAPPPQVPGVSSVQAPEDELVLQTESAAAAGADLRRLLPEIFDGYRVVRELGRGGMGAVLLADHLDLRRKAAIKIMLPGAEAIVPQANERFMREARAVARLKHPNIVEIYGVGHVNGMPYLSMEFVEGRMLSDYIEKDRLGHPQSVELLAKIGRALAFAHAQGVIHRDIKPENIMVRHNGEPVLMDFGLAKDFGKESVKLSMTGSVMGTPSYMSPEQAQGLTVDERSDVYSLGAVMYEALTHRAPFEGKTMVATIYQVVNERATPVREINAAVPPLYERVCMTAMSKDPQRRYATMEDFARDLEALAAGRAVSISGPSAAERLGDWIKSHKQLATGLGVGAAALLVLALAFSAGWLRPGRSRADEMQRALTEGSPESRLLHMKALAAEFHDGRIKHDSPEAGDAVKALGLAAADDSSEGAVAVAALQALGETKLPAAGPLIKPHASAPRPPSVRKAALAAYAQIHPVDTGELLFGALRDDPDEGVRLAALEALGDLPDPTIMLYLIKLATRNDPPALAAAARHKLTRMRKPDSILAIYAGGRGASAAQALGETLAQTADYNKQLEDAMNEMENPGAKQPERKADPFEVAADKVLKGNLEERLQAAYDLGVLADARAEARLAAALQDQDADVALAAADALGKLPPLKNRSALEAHLANPSPATRRAAARALGLVKPPWDGASLAAALAQERDATVQAEMAVALGRLRSPKAGAPLLALLADGAPVARRKAAWALGQLGSPFACAPLVDALERAGDDRELKAEASGALSAITGKTHGADAAKWREEIKKLQ
ncbi:MAG: protein kinase [Planctomycetota bacterium]|nr:protein kinase [Planctomycetota bacterium]